MLGMQEKLAELMLYILWMPIWMQCLGSRLKMLTGSFETRLRIAPFLGSLDSDMGIPDSKSMKGTVRTSRWRQMKQQLLQGQ
jgi:hypothetical protein